MYFKQIYDPKLSQYAYLVGCQVAGEAIIIDPLRDIDQYNEQANREGLNITAAADTHIHADYVSGLREFAEKGVNVYASDEGGDDWRYEWLLDSDYDYQLLSDQDTFTIGNVKFEVKHTPGHTPESLSFLVTDKAATDQPMGILTGDFVFVGDIGRPDLLETAAGQQGAMKPAAQTLYNSVEEFKGLPAYLQVWPAHGSGSACGKAMGSVPETTVGYELRFSLAFKASDSEDDFVNYILEGQPEPPLYFSRMKKVNKEGPAILGNIPDPRHYTVDEFLNKDGVIVDARERHSFMEGHLPDSLLATFDKNFNTVAGSYIDANSDIYLVIGEEHLEQATRDLIRVGLDRIKGYTTTEELGNWDGQLRRVPAIDFEYVEEHREEGDKLVLDVRKATEYAEGHVPDATHIAYTRLPEHLDVLPKDKEIMVHCSSGQRASYAAGLLSRKGFQVEWIDDLFEDWSEKHGEAVTALR